MAKIKTIAFLTRVHPDRPNMLKTCIDSVKSQSDNDYIHIFIKTDKTKNGYGKWNANRSFATITNIPAKYSMVLDDDDMLIDNDFVKDFKEVIKERMPEIVFFKGNVHKLGILPRPGYWKRPPIYGQIASFCDAIRTDIWLKYIRIFGKRELGGDYCFISTCYHNTRNHLWWDRIVARTQKGPGRAKNEREHL